jgi:hypothetical protein
VELAIAADHFLIDSLKDVCIDAIRSVVTEENVWKIVEQLSFVNLFDLTGGCYQVIVFNILYVPFLSIQFFLVCIIF